MKVDLQTVGWLIVSFFDQAKVQQTARLSQFVQRASAVRAWFSCKPGSLLVWNTAG